MNDTTHIEVRNLTMAYGSRLIMQEVAFSVPRGTVTAIVGGSGCGKSTLLRHMLGLLEPVSGEVLYSGESFTAALPARRNEMLRRFGVTFQQGALWSSMTLLENVALPIEEYTKLPPGDVVSLARLKLSLVGLSGFEDYYPADISGGMRKRAGLARALALDPEVLFFDEPSAGLDPVSSRRLDELILKVCGTTGASVIIVTHELASIFAIAAQAVFLDVATKRVGAIGSPRELAQNPPSESVRSFFAAGHFDAGA
ncbi:MAG TPA: ATP-binding cassette domain-containing protein [Opitutales bacterium]|nr:ATP-binding cassette domain-containing protein [Opitutales bacterium]